MKRVLFIDRDGTLVKEPKEDLQLDSLEKLEFVPSVFKYMGLISEKMDFELSMVTNQDGLGTDSFPEDTFWPAHNKMLDAFIGEGVFFEKFFIDKSFPEDNAETRKPRTGMLTEYINNDDYDMSSSFVIGDRLTDIELAKNLGCKGILFQEKEAGEAMLEESNLADSCVLITGSWSEIYDYLLAGERTSKIVRTTKETDILIDLNLDGSGKGNMSTGLNFFDHMLDQIAKHSGCDLTIKVNGDLEVDEHHTIEDTAIALGEAFLEALGDKRGIERYGYCLPMDDCVVTTALDFGGRPWLVWEAEFNREMVGDMPTEMFLHFFKSFSDAAKANLYIKAEGQNEHHKIEGIFKALARSLKMAVKRDVFNFELPSTKGVL